MQAWIIPIILSFVLRQLEQFTSGIDWDKVEKDLVERIKKLVPGKIFDDAAVKITITALHAVRKALESSGQLQIILDLLVQGRSNEALALLKKLLLEYLDSKKLTADESKIKSLIA